MMCAEDRLWLKIVNNAQNAFYDHFHYMPNHPNELFFDANAYSSLLHKCIHDQFDYTIELYGTPAEQMLRKRQPNELIID